MPCVAGRIEVRYRMYLNKSIAVVVPCKNEASQITGVMESMPDMVDAIVVIDDGSTDGMDTVVKDYAQRDDRVHLIRHEQSQGVGGAIAAGYAWARHEGFDISVVMAGDGQMDPDDLQLVVHPVAAGLADYCKGNRFTYPGGIQRIPPTRKFGNFVLSILTKIASGYWHVSDTQTGYTSISLSALERIDVEKIYHTYGCPNDILIRLNVAEMRVCEVPINPLYNVGEKSKMRVFRVMRPILWLLFKRFGWRMVYKHIIISGHPLVASYVFSALFLLTSVALCVLVIVKRIATGEIGPATLITSGVFLIVGIQFLLTAFWMDSDANRHLCVRLTPDLIDSLRPKKTRFQRPGRTTRSAKSVNDSSKAPEPPVVETRRESIPAGRTE